MTLETKSLETKDAANGLEIKDAFDDFLRAFEAFKETNDERLSQIERKSADVVTDEKVDRINRALDEQKRALDELTLAASRPSLGGEFKAAPGRAVRERKTAFDRYMRKGDASGFDALELKSLSAGSNPDGGYIVPLEIEQTIDRVLEKYSPIRAIASVRQIGTNTYRKPITTTGAATGWVAETGDRTETTSPTLSAIDFPAMELYAMPAATQVLLDDAQVDTEAWLASEVQTVFAEQESTAFVSGDGTAKPKGFLAYTTVADASWAWSKIGYIVTGVSAGFAASNPADNLLDLAYAPKQGYRANGHWVMNLKSDCTILMF
jgi:HK97 family phage major capsid protein